VPTELHVYPGAYHGFDGFAANSRLGRQFNDDRDAALRNALGSDPAS
jgi:triacylglycerol lipase